LAALAGTLPEAGVVEREELDAGFVDDPCDVRQDDFLGVAPSAGCDDRWQRPVGALGPE
jgi:hypothetical protein